jgi:hypothetical protein
MKKLIEGGPGQPEERQWQMIDLDLKKFSGQELPLRVYQHVLVGDRLPGNAYWRQLELK